jgi:ADP-ribose pyrophosphatase YjhB (NUDIX family)
MHIDSLLYDKIKSVLPIACVDVILVSSGQFLLCRRIDEPAAGQWWFPGGRVHYRETLVQACQRKCMEEVGLAVEAVQIVGVEETIFDDPPVHTLNIVYLARLIGTRESINLDATQSEFGWFEEVDSAWHQGVINPLLRAGYVLGPTKAAATN